MLARSTATTARAGMDSIAVIEALDKCAEMAAIYGYDPAAFEIRDVDGGKRSSSVLRRTAAAGNWGAPRRDSRRARSLHSAPLATQQRLGRLSAARLPGSHTIEDGDRASLKDGFDDENWKCRGGMATRIVIRAPVNAVKGESCRKGSDAG